MTREALEFEFSAEGVWAQECPKDRNFPQICIRQWCSQRPYTLLAGLPDSDRKFFEENLQVPADGDAEAFCFTCL